METHLVAPISRPLPLLPLLAFLLVFPTLFLSSACLFWWIFCLTGLTSFFLCLFLVSPFPPLLLFCLVRGPGLMGCSAHAGWGDYDYGKTLVACTDHVVTGALAARAGIRYGTATCTLEASCVRTFVHVPCCSSSVLSLAAAWQCG
jgi:hypothetical protein